jgi:hypothetical protein
MVTVRKSGVFRTLTADDLIDAPELLPGFSIQVRTLFEQVNVRIVIWSGGVAQLARATVS